MADKTDRIFTGAGRTAIRREGSGKVARKQKYVGGVGNQSKLMERKGPRKRG